MRHPAHHPVIFMVRASHYNNLIEKENITCNFSKADYEKERNFELPLFSGVKSQFPILRTNEYPKNITVNPAHDSLDDTNATNAKASEKLCNWECTTKKT